jgi:hypothetical protein
MARGLALGERGWGHVPLPPRWEGGARGEVARCTRAKHKHTSDETIVSGVVHSRETPPSAAARGWGGGARERRPS